MSGLLRLKAESPRFEIACLYLISVILLFAALPFDHGVNADFGARIMDAGHFPLFFLLTFASTKRCKGNLLSVGFLIACFAGLVEIVQPFFGRSESSIDLINGLLGIGAGLLLQHLLKQRTGTRSLFLFSALCLSTQSVMLFPAYREWESIDWRRRNFPLLASFEHEEELRLWENSCFKEGKEISNQSSTEGQYSLRIHCPLPKPLTAVYYAGDLDWSSYSQFSGDVFSPVESLRLHFRIDDSHDCTEFESRFNSVVVLRKGWNHFEFQMTEIQSKPKLQALDLKEIRRVLLFLEEPQSDALLIDNVRLQGKASK